MKINATGCKGILPSKSKVGTNYRFSRVNRKMNRDKKVVFPDGYGMTIRGNTFLMIIIILRMLEVTRNIKNERQSLIL